MPDYKEKKPIKLPDTYNIDPNFERMLKSFMKQVQKEGILEEVRRRRYYIKPSELKRLAKKSRKK